MRVQNKKKQTINITLKQIMLYSINKTYDFMYMNKKTKARCNFFFFS
jgi:hypothetical protein